MSRKNAWRTGKVCIYKPTCSQGCRPSPCGRGATFSVLHDALSCILWEFRALHTKSSVWIIRNQESGGKRVGKRSRWRTTFRFEFLSGVAEAEAEAETAPGLKGKGHAATAANTIFLMPEKCAEMWFNICDCESFPRAPKRMPDLFYCAAWKGFNSRSVCVWECKFKNYDTVQPVEGDTLRNKLWEINAEERAVTIRNKYKSIGQGNSFRYELAAS